MAQRLEDFVNGVRPQFGGGGGFDGGLGNGGSSAGTGSFGSG
jgi:hypothetical protein